LGGHGRQPTLIWDFYASPHSPEAVAAGFGAEGSDSDFVLSIDIPDEFAASHSTEWTQVEQIPGTTELMESGYGWRASNEVWLSAEEANQYRQTITIYDSADGEEVRPDLVET
jgi:hypothetical protein